MDINLALDWLLVHKGEIWTVWASTVTVASIVIKWTPTVKDDTWLKKIVSFVGKFLALDKYGPVRNKKGRVIND